MGVIRIVSVPVRDSYGSSLRDLALSVMVSRIQVPSGGRVPQVPTLHLGLLFFPRSEPRVAAPVAQLPYA
jgi:hypothetical protein